MAIDKKKIAKNSIALYLRMFITVGITFYTSRVILRTLGVEDFGTYNVVAGIAVMFTFMSNALSSANVRFLTIAIGTKDSKKIVEVFSMAIKSHFFIGLAVVLISEIVGLWLIYNELSIPPKQLATANLIFQFALLSVFFNVINLPYLAAVIAEEKMSFFAYVQIFESLAKLGISFLIVLFPDKLLAYGSLLFVLSFLVFFANRIYCKKKLSHIRYDKSIFNNKLLKEIATFSWWNIVKYGAIMANGQANTILLNIWGGPIASAAMAIYNQVNSALTRFFESFQTAFAPQITKNWGAGDIISFNKLIMTSCKFSSIMIFLPAIPLSLFMQPVLELWLKTVPDNTATICQLGLLCLWLDTMTGPTSRGIMAIGDIRNYQIISSIIWVMSVPLSILLLMNGMPFKYILVSKFVILMISVAYNTQYLSKKAQFSRKGFLINNIIIPLIILVISYIIGFIYSRMIQITLLLNFVTTTVITSVAVIFLLYTVGMNSNERAIVMNYLRTKTLKFHRTER